MTKNNSDWPSVAMIGIIGLGAWYLIGKMFQGTSQSVVDKVIEGGGSLLDSGGKLLGGGLQFATDTTVDDAWAWLFGQDAVDGDPIIRDSHGCVQGVSSWCESLKGCVVHGLTCPVLHTNEKTEPTTDPNQCSSGWSWCEKQGHCVMDYLNTESYCDSSFVPLWEQPTEDRGWEPGLRDVCTWPNGDPLTVPAGMDCGEAQDAMCARFRSIPGYKGCS